MRLIKKIFFSFLILAIPITSNANIVIKYKIGDEIITNIDILNEKKYLIFLRPELKNIPDKEINSISQNSIIRETIKKREVDKIFKNIDNIKLVNDIKNNLFEYKKVKNEVEFKKLLQKDKINYEKIIDKMKYEALWNELVYKKFNSLVKINENKLKQVLKLKVSSNKKYEYNLSELVFDINNKENFKEKYGEVLKNIKNYDFKYAATKFSLAESGRKGGQIGWIKETLLSDTITNNLKNKKKKSITEPIKIPSGYLLLKINDKREIKQKINIEKELDELKKFERNKQLNQFSLVYYKKLKQNTIINEY